MFRARHLLLLAFSLGLTGCLTASGITGGSERKKDGEGVFSRVGKWLAEDPQAKKKSAKVPETPPLTHQLPIGSVHLVHEDARFLLIRSSRTTTVAPDAELLTYDSGGRPTGKLKLSPERKSGFLAADIVEGRPKTGDRVVVFGQSTDPAPLDAPNPGGLTEVLE